jgi:DNA-binding transcriptional MerR regulator
MRIGELAKATGTSPKTLRFYEDAGLLTPAERTANGYRQFTAEAVDRLDFIRRGRAAGLTLAQIRDVIELRDGGTTPCRHVNGLLSSRLADLDRRIAELQALRETVAQLRDNANEADPDTCRPEDVCRYL